MIQGLIFDFDGLILETEGPIFQSWQELYRQYGFDLEFARWGTIIGTAEALFDPLSELQAQAAAGVDWEAAERHRRAREAELIAQQPALPGVKEYLEQAAGMRLRLAIASSSSRQWVEGHLSRLGLLHYFDCLKTQDDVPRTKPDPALFLAALEALDLQPDQVVVFEDSPHGLLAAKRAGCHTVAVPNALTAQLDLSLADLRLESLVELPLADLLHHFNSHSG